MRFEDRTRSSRVVLMARGPFWRRLGVCLEGDRVYGVAGFSDEDRRVVFRRRRAYRTALSKRSRAAAAAFVS